jgi:uncharacterized protein YciI
VTELDAYAFVLLRRPAAAPDLPEAELDLIQERHLAHLASLTKAGKIVAAGPFSDQPDESLRGLCIYRTSLDEARTLAGQDPAVQAGRLAVDVMTWWTEKGSVSFTRA